MNVTDFINFLNHSQFALLATIGTVIASSLIAVVVKDYSSRISKVVDLNERIENLALKIEILKESAIAANVEAGSVKADKGREEIVEEVISRFGEQVADEAILSMKEKLGQHAMLDTIDRYIREASEHIMARIIDEISWTRRRASLNLQIGIYVTFTAVTVLAYASFTINGSSTTDAIGYIELYAPRFFLIVLIEIFAYFFLRMHKENVREVRSLTNEKSAMEGKLLGARLAARTGANLEAVISELSKLERTPILERGQSTVEIEALKHQTLTDNALLDRITKLLGSLRGKK